MTLVQDILKLVETTDNVSEKKPNVNCKSPRLTNAKGLKKHEARHPFIGDNVLDSRDLAKMLDDLRSEREGLEDDVGSASSDDERADAEAALADFNDADDKGKLIPELEAAESNVPEWEYGATLIANDYWVDYCKELVSDVGDLPRNIPDYIAIDWEQTAENLQADYSAIDLGGETYWFRK